MRAIVVPYNQSEVLVLCKAHRTFVDKFHLVFTVECTSLQGKSATTGIQDIGNHHRGYSPEPCCRRRQTCLQLPLYGLDEKCLLYRCMQPSLLSVSPQIILLDVPFQMRRRDLVAIGPPHTLCGPIESSLCDTHHKLYPSQVTPIKARDTRTFSDRLRGESA